MRFRRSLLFVCLFLLVIGGATSVTGFYMRTAMARLEAEGVEAIATVDWLRSTRTGSSSTKSTTYRVGMHVDWQGRRFDLVDQLRKKQWRALSEGDPLAVTFVPDGSGLCRVGSLDDAASHGELSGRVAIGGSTLFAVTAVVLGGTWRSFGKPTFREWAGKDA